MRFLPAILLTTMLLAQTPSPIQYNRDGKLLLPKEYRSWIFLTSSLGMNYAPGAKDSADPEFDNVFVNPSSYQSFLKTGAWPDKTILIKENRVSDNHASITTAGRSQATVVNFEANVKDASKGGWAFYMFTSKDSTEGAVMPKTASCYSCHSQNGAVDTTFVQYYPTLIDIAKAKGTYKTSEK
ncbi:MAG TPA: cytochrome P460 family protein [Bryobacteraceae bacterium]|jgi:hypothetical protein